MFENWIEEDLPVQLVGVGKNSHLSYLGNWASDNDASICADSSPFPVWGEWGASQRDLFILNHEGEVVFHESISSGIPSNLESLVLSLVGEIALDCDPDLACPEVLTCCDGLLYPTGCCSDNCDEPIEDVDNICGSECDSNLACPGVLTCCDGLLYPTGCCSNNCDEPIEDFYNICSEPVCEDGEFDNTNPCNPMECFDGQWFEIVIDCPEQMGIPCDGEYVSPPEGECCSICVEQEDCLDGEFDNTNPCNPMECFDGQWFEIVIDCAEQTGVPCDGGIYVDPPEGECCSTCIQYGDSNSDGSLNVLDVVSLVNLALSNQYNELLDMNNDSVLNVLDVVQLIDSILN